LAESLLNETQAKLKTQAAEAQQEQEQLLAMHAQELARAGKQRALACHDCQYPMGVDAL
jgi:hypothetical protein